MTGHPFYVTTPIYYINAKPHIGHAYTTVVADAIARSRRLSGDDVIFLTGTDEHGQKVERAARKAGVDVRVFAEEVSDTFRTMCRDLSISNDDFIRTTEARHQRAAQALWQRVAAAGDIYKDRYEGWYCTVDEVFVPETQLVDGRCPTCGGQLERLQEESYYFRLSKYRDQLLELYERNPEFVQPGSRLNEVRSFVEGGLQDLSISRTSFRWGIPVPGDPEHVMYVWFDALTNYLTALGYGSDASDSDDRIARHWPTVTHLMAKEIIRQHAIYWPAFLLAAGIAPPRRIVAHGHWMMGGAKMSKTVGNVAGYQEYAAIFGVDALRYFLLREMPLGQDAQFADDAILTRFNADLANDLGNLVSRTVTMIHRYRAGIVPAPTRPPAGLEAGLVDGMSRTIDAVRRSYAAFQMSVALQQTWELVRHVNKYIVEREPWALAKRADEGPVLDGTLYHAADALRVIAALVEPAMPHASERIRGMLGVPQEMWTALAPGSLAEGTRLGSPEPLFPRIERTREELRTMSDTPPVHPEPVPAITTGAAPAAGSAPSPPPSSTALAEPVSYDDFMKIELRVAKVLQAEVVPKSKRLLKLTVDTGTEERTIVAGIAEAYQPEDLVGRSVVVVFNLRPAKLMGVESNGMVLAASVEGGPPTLVSVEGVAPGARVR
jgi:methionyl-tRNA synthetase